MEKMRKREIYMYMFTAAGAKYGEFCNEREGDLVRRMHQCSVLGETQVGETRPYN